MARGSCRVTRADARSYATFPRKVANGGRWRRFCSHQVSRRGRRRRHTMTVKFFPNDKGNPAGKLADAELHFTGGPLDGLKLVGFGIWERRNGGRNVTFPARQYS